MNGIFVLAYLFVLGVLFRVLSQDELARRFSRKQKAYVVIAVLFLLTVYFLPYMMGWVQPTRVLPAWLVCGLFFLIAGCGFVLQTFYPEKAPQYKNHFIVATGIVISLIWFGPLILSIWR